MGNTLRVFSVILFLVFFVGFTTPSSAQENKLGLASSSSPGIVKQKVKESIELVPKKIADIDKALGTADLPDEKELLLKKKNGLEATLANLKNPKSNTPGYLGLLGAPLSGSAIYLWGFLWAIWVGWIFSTVGAFGGIMAGVGHITIFGLGDYAKSFGKGMPINKLLTDSTRVSNQWLVGLAALISATNYYKMGRLVLPLGICLGIGSVAASYSIPVLTAGQISFKSYMGYFGLCVLLLGIFLTYQITPKGQRSKKAAKQAAKEFEKAKGKATEQGVKVIEGSYTGMIIALLITLSGALWGNLMRSMQWYALIVVAFGVILGFIIARGKVRFTFYGVEFAFKGWIPIVGGVFIAALASFLGVGGGFLFVPFLTAVAGLPMFLVAGTSGLAVLVGMIVSIFTYMVAKEIPVQWSFIGAELIGIFVGAMIGPRTQKYLSDKALSILFIVLALLVGVRYTLKGFFPHIYAATGLP
jgi:uncharacterized membrane protein YfcA